MSAIVRRNSSGYGSVSTSGRRELSPTEKVLINYRYIRDHLDTPAVCDQLIKRGVWDEEDGQSISTGGTVVDQSERLLQKLLLKTGGFDDIYDVFIETLKNFVITIDEYIEVYDHHLRSRTNTCAVLTRAIVKMTKLFQTIYGFMKAFPSLKEKVSRFDNRRDRNAVKVEIIRGNYPSLPSGTHESQCQMSITMNNEDAWKITHAIQNRHPELLYLFTKYFQASTLQANVGSIIILFKANTAVLSQSLLSFIDEKNEPLSTFLGDLLFNCGVTRTRATRATFFDMTIECALFNGTSNNFIHFDPAEVIDRRGKMLSDVLKLEDFVVMDKLGAYVKNTVDLIDMILELEKCDVFLKHIKETEHENVYNRISWSGK